jgi:hypothetical protein
MRGIQRSGYLNVGLLPFAFFELSGVHCLFRLTAWSAWWRVVRGCQPLPTGTAGLARRACLTNAGLLMTFGAVRSWLEWACDSNGLETAERIGRLLHYCTNALMHYCIQMSSQISSPPLQMSSPSFKCHPKCHPPPSNVIPFTMQFFGSVL